MRPIAVFGLVRCLMGGGLLIAPDAVATRWVGKASDRGAVRVYSRALGVREIVLGAATMVSPAELRRPALLAGVLCDGVDFATTLAARRRHRASGDFAGVLAPGLATASGLLLAAAAGSHQSDP